MTTTKTTTSETTSMGSHVRGQGARVARGAGAVKEGIKEEEAAMEEQVERSSSDGIYGATRQRRRKKDRYRDFEGEYEESDDEEGEEEAEESIEEYTESRETEEEEEGVENDGIEGESAQIVMSRSKRTVRKRNCNHRCFFVCVRAA